MSNVVKLEQPQPIKGAGRSSPRPVEICYSGGGYPGHCKSIRRAIVSATRHIMETSGAARANILIDGEIVADLDKVFGRCFITWRAKWAKNSELW